MGRAYGSKSALKRAGCVVDYVHGPPHALQPARHGAQVVAQVNIGHEVVAPDLGCRRDSDSSRKASSSSSARLLRVVLVPSYGRAVQKNGMVATTPLDPLRVCNECIEGEYAKDVPRLSPITDSTSSAISPVRSWAAQHNPTLLAREGLKHFL